MNFYYTPELLSNQREQPGVVAAIDDENFFVCSKNEENELDASRVIVPLREVYPGSTTSQLRKFFIEDKDM